MLLNQTNVLVENKKLNSDQYTRGNIEQLFTNQTKYIDLSWEPNDISGGYLLERDYENKYAQELSGFQSSVNIAYDLKNDEKIQSFIPTTSSLELISNILMSVHPESTHRAKILTGAYGRGKSHIILVALSMLYRENRGKVFNNLLSRMKDYNEDIIEILALSHKQFELLEQSISLLFSRIGDLMKDQSILDEIRNYESNVDVYERKLLEKTYSRGMDLAECMQLSRFTEDLCDLSDIAENIADKIQIMLVTRKA